jgi:hypothetical protein
MPALRKPQIEGVLSTASRSWNSSKWHVSVAVGEESDGERQSKSRSLTAIPTRRGWVRDDNVKAKAG